MARAMLAPSTSLLTISTLVLVTLLLSAVSTAVEQVPQSEAAVTTASSNEEQLSEVLNTEFQGEDDGIVDFEMLEADEKVETPPPHCKCPKHHHKHKKHRLHIPVEFSHRDVEELNVILNAEYLEAEFFLHAGYGFGLNEFNGTSVNVTGPPPIGAQKAHTGRFIEHLAKEFGLQSLGHIR